MQVREDQAALAAPRKGQRGILITSEKIGLRLVKYTKLRQIVS